MILDSTRDKVTKQSLTIDVAKRTGLPQVDVRLVIEQTLGAIKENLIARQPIEIRGFGTFAAKKRKGRIARNPKKPDQTVIVPDRSVPTFKYSRELKSRIKVNE